MYLISVSGLILSTYTNLKFNFRQYYCVIESRVRKKGKITCVIRMDLNRGRCHHMEKIIFQKVNGG